MKVQKVAEKFARSILEVNNFLLEKSTFRKNSSSFKIKDEILKKKFANTP